jgi:hypothetical protein
LTLWLLLAVAAAAAQPPATTPAADEAAREGPVQTPKPPPPRVTPAVERVLELQLLDRVTGRTTPVEIRPGQWGRSGRLQILGRACVGTPPHLMPNDRAFVEIVETKTNGQRVRIYSGWMFAASPALNGLEHPRYDVWLRRCRMNFPDIGPETISAGAVRPSGSKGKKVRDLSSDDTEPEATEE